MLASVLNSCSCCSIVCFFVLTLRYIPTLDMSSMAFESPINGNGALLFRLSDVALSVSLMSQAVLSALIMAFDLLYATQ